MAESKASFGYMTTNVACSSDDQYPAAVSVTRQLEWETSMTATSSTRLGEGLTIWGNRDWLHLNSPNQIKFTTTLMRLMWPMITELNGDDGLSTNPRTGLLMSNRISEGGMGATANNIP